MKQSKHGKKLPDTDGKKQSNVRESENVAFFTPALKLLLDEQETSDFLGVSASFLRKCRCQGRSLYGTKAKSMTPPPFTRIGGRVYYKRSDLQKWVDDLVSQDVI